MQEGILFHYIKSPESGDYFQQLCLELSGFIDENVVETAWNVVIKNNEMLRIVYRWENVKKPVQLVLNKHTVDIRQYDLYEGTFMMQGLGSINLTEAVEEIKQVDRSEKFDLREVPFRVTLIKIDSSHTYMIISSHHIIYDGWSSGIILKEFFEAYDDHIKGKYSAKSNKLSFKEYVKWVRGHEAREGEEFWKNYLSGFETPHRLTYRNISNEANYSVERRKLCLDRQMVQQLENFTKKHKVTLASLFYCGWGILLSKYCNTEDVIFGTTISGRSVPLSGIENLVGLFIETIPLRCKNNGTQPVLDLLKLLNCESLIREEYSYVPLVKIKELSPLGNDVELFDTIVVLENYPLPDQTGSLRCDSYSMEETTHYNLTVTITLASEIVVELVCRADLFTDAVLNRQIGHFSRIIEQISTNEKITIPEVDILSKQEKQEILVEFNSTESSYPQDKTITDLFRRQVRSTSDIVALISPSTNYSGQAHSTYRELEEKSDRLAIYLKGQNINSEKLVAVKMGRSLEMMIAIFGILMTKAAYLPIDSAYPADRIKYILTDSNAKLLLTDRQTPGQEYCFVAVLDGVYALESWKWDEPNKGDEWGIGKSNFHLPAHKELAYVIYTSGSTGKPKGVMISQYSIINRLNWMQKAYPIGQGDVILQKTPIVFDVSVWELFWWSFYGSRLCLLAPGEEKNPGAIADIIAKQKITTIHFVPSMLRVFMHHLEEVGNMHTLKSLKQVFSSGEALDSSQVMQFKRLLFNTNFTHLINLYGPTEATVDVSYFNCFIEKEVIPEPVPIGKPIDNISLFILDLYLNLQPVGVPGELGITGVGLARGYLNQPELTQERFCLRRPGGALFEKTAPPGPPRKNFLLGDDSYSYSIIHTPMYKTGDLARWRLDGNIEFIGRLDHQVKIRGFRIEPGEIRDCILTFSGIKDAIVIADKTTQGESYLCAYTVGINNREEALKKHLSDFLPYYMVPSYIIEISTIPLSVNGKIDFKALPKPGFTCKPEHEAPQTEIEKKLGYLWAQLLETDETLIGRDDSFFRLGGHSLNAVLMVSGIHRLFQVKLTLNEVFNQPKIRQLAELIRTREKEKYLNIEQAPLKSFYPVSSAQKRLFVIQQMNPDTIDYNMNWVFAIYGDLKVEKLEKAINRLLQRHEVLRTGVEMRGIEPVQVIHEIPFQPLEYVTMKSASDLHIGNQEKKNNQKCLRESRAPRRGEPIEDLQSTTPLMGKNRTPSFNQVSPDGQSSLDSNKDNQKFLRGPGAVFSKRAPGCRRRLLELVRQFVQPFDLSSPPLMRVRLIKIKDGAYILLVDLHHIVTDDISNRVLFEELLAFYGGEELPGIRLQYKDYSYWQNQRLAAGKMKVQEEFWCRQFSGGVPRLDLPLDFPRPVLPDGVGDRILITIGEELTGRISKMMEETTVTPYMFFLAVYFILLSRFCGATDIVIGTAVAGRRHANLENIVGMFVNMLAIRIHVQGGLTFNQFLERVKTETIDAFDNQEYPFDNLVENINVEARPGRNPLFDVEFNLFSHTRRVNWDEPIETDGLVFRRILQHHETLPYDLGLSVWVKDNTYDLELGYQTALFKSSTIQEMLREYLEIMELCLVKPDTLLEEMISISGPDGVAGELTQEDVLDFDF